jgi:tetratricopeptide (TPR) repeat protein
MRQALAWAWEQDPAVAVRLVVALAAWWYLRGRFAEAYPLLSEAAGHAAEGSEVWCDAQLWLSRTVSYAGDLAEALSHDTAVRDAIAGQAPGRVLAECLAERTGLLANMGRIAEAVADGRRALDLARELGYTFAEHAALTGLTIAASKAGDLDGAFALARQAEQTSGDMPGQMARN